jgi:hypothetical protein
MRMARKLAAAGVRNFGKNHATQLEPALRVAIEFSGLKSIAHFVSTAKNSIRLDAPIDLSFQEVVPGVLVSAVCPNAAFASSSGRPSRFANPTPTKTSTPPAI